MMQVSRGVWRSSEPVEQVKAVLVRRFGRPPDEATDDRLVWRSSAYLTRHRLVFDRQTGRITRVTETTDLVRLGSWLTALSALVFTVSGGTPWAELSVVGAFACCLKLLAEGDVTVSPGYELTDYEVAPELFVTLAVVVGALLSIPILNVVWKATILTGSLAYLSIHLLQGSLSVGPLATDTSRATARFRIPAFAAASVCYAVLAHELTVIAVRAVAEPPGSPRVAYPIGLVTAIVTGGWALSALYGSVETSMDEIWGRAVGDTEPFRLRVVAVGVFSVTTAANAVVVAYLLELLWHPLAGTRLFPWLFPETLLTRVSDAVVSPATESLGVGLAVLPIHLVPFAPVVVSWLLGVGYVGYRTVGRARLLRRADPLDRSLATADPPTVFVTDRDGITVRPARTLSGRPVVVVHATLATRLSDDELSAVVAHEASHLADDDWLVGLVTTVAAVVPTVGPNAVRVFYDYASAERAADDAAVAAVGLAPTMRALRKVDEFQRAGPTERYPGLGGPELLGPAVDRLRHAWDDSFGRLTGRQLARRVGIAYYFLFGRAVFDAVHLPLETRVSRLAERHES